MYLSRLLVPGTVLLAATIAAAQPVDLGSNGRNEAPSRHGVTASSFDLNGSAVSRGSGEIQLQLPGGPMTLLRRKSFQSRGNNGGLWRGSANLRPDSDVLLTLRNGYLAGTIRVGADLYEVRPAAGNRHVVEKLNQAAFLPCKSPLHTAAGADTAGRTVATAPVTAGDASTVTVDLLSVYTPEARVAAGGTAQMEATIQAAVDQANLSFTNSLINASYRLVRTAEVTHHDAGDLSLDLSWVQSDPTVAALRNAAGADLVSLVVENGAGYCGLGYIMQSVGPGFAGTAFQATARSCAVGNLSFAHEHGHNLGLEHDPANGSAVTAASYAWSYGHLVDGVFRTVMSYASQCPSGCTRVPFYSNPSVTYSGYQTGVADQRDNARTIRLTASVAASFRAEAPTTAPVAPSALTAVAASSTQVNLSWADNSTNEAGFKIERSADGVTFAQIAAPGAGVTTYSNTGLTGGSTYTYRVRAYNVVGDSDPANDAIVTTPLPKPPLAPASLSAAAMSSSQINLAWADQSNNESGYRIQRSTDGVNFALIFTTGANATTYSSTGLASATTYSYRVQAFNADGSSPYTNVATAATPAGAPPTPGGFTGAAKYTVSSRVTTLAAVSLSWTDVAGNTGYNIERCKQSGKGRTASCSYAALTNPSADASAFLDSGVAAVGKGTYQYRIRAFSTAGGSNWVEITVNAN